MLKGATCCNYQLCTKEAVFGNYLITLAHKRFVETFKNGQCHAMCGLQYS